VSGGTSLDEAQGFEGAQASVGASKERWVIETAINGKIKGSKGHLCLSPP
jgi:hypothetical protein